MPDVWYTTHWTYAYEDDALPAEVDDGKLRIAVEYEHFEWVEGEEGGEPHAIHATSADGRYRIDIMFRSPAAQELLRRGLVEGAPTMKEDAG